MALRRIDDIYLIEKLKEGDIHALEVIFNKYYSSLCNYLTLLFRDKIVVEHIAQDIFVYLWENRASLEIKISLESYLYTAGRYKAINQIRNNKRHDEILREIGSRQPDNVVTSVTNIEVEELQSLIENAIASLPERCQQIFRLSRDDEMSYKEISEFLGISINTVEGQISIALKKLRTVLRPFYLRILLTL